MATMPAAATSGAPTDSASAMGASDSAAATDTGTTLCTVMADPNGGYTLIAGDEPEADTSGASDQGSGQHFDDKGALLKAILTILTEADSSQGASGSSEDQFQAGFSGGDDAGATSGATPAQKY